VAASRTVDAGLLAAADRRIRESPDLSSAESLVVLHRGEVVFEAYYRGRSADDLVDIHSVTKSFTSAVVGTLLGDGRLALDTPVVSVLPHLPVNDPAKRQITVRHLLTMTSGLTQEGEWDLCEIALRGRPWVETAFDAPLIAPPGTTYAYNNGAVHVLSAVVSEIAGRPMAEVACERLLVPLGIGRVDWPADPAGLSSGFGRLAIRPRDLAAFGQLFLQGGAWNGCQLLDADFVAAATSRQAPGEPRPPEMTSYGFLWWVDELASPPAFFAGGYGGQYVYAVPALLLVAVTTADAFSEPRRFGRLLRGLIESYVVAAARPAA
jgi:CubicO group peptidase (beta-lactamase class C family)